MNNNFRKILMNKWTYPYEGLFCNNVYLAKHYLTVHLRPITFFKIKKLNVLDINITKLHTNQFIFN